MKTGNSAVAAAVVSALLIVLGSRALADSTKYVQSTDGSPVPAFASPGAFCSYLQNGNANASGKAVVFLTSRQQVTQTGQTQSTCNDRSWPLATIRRSSGDSIWYVLPANLSDS